MNINELPLNNIKIINEISYPHASNEITVCEGLVNNKKEEFIIKVSRRIDANLKNEVETLNQIEGEGVETPKILDYNLGKVDYIVLEKVEGKRLSELNNIGLYDKRMLLDFGRSLGKIHSLNINTKEAPKRKFHKCADTENEYILKVNKWLETNEPKTKNYCFCHGDHHYANLLFKNNKLSVVLDWELAGIGLKEFDMAWAMVLRPGQKFFNTKTEEEMFLKGYREFSRYNNDTYNWCKVLVYSHFYLIGLNQNLKDYVNYIADCINEITN